MPRLQRALENYIVYVINGYIANKSCIQQLHCEPLGERCNDSNVPSQRRGH